MNPLYYPYKMQNGFISYSQKEHYVIRHRNI